MSAWFYGIDSEHCKVLRQRIFCYKDYLLRWKWMYVYVKRATVPLQIFIKMESKFRDVIDLHKFFSKNLNIICNTNILRINFIRLFK